MKKVLVVCGATASGKTALAVECAKKLNTEVISADSMLIYKGLSIGTAKPTLDEMQGVKHHLIDVVSPTENFSVSDYEKTALPIVERLLAENKTPVICGGTGFYIQSLLYKSGFGNAPANPQIRQKYEEILEREGCEYLHSLLSEKDKESAEKLHPNDTKRVIRALEIFDVTGKKKSEQNDTLTPRFPFVCVSVDYPRELLYERINLRVDIMFEQGLKEEVQNLLNQGITGEMQCMQGIGYKEVLEGLQKGWSDEEIKELIKKNTRNYAKRQITFFKRMQNHFPFSYDKLDADGVISLLE
ncbi:MAG: tRNA (adenosine(37)-N6)-dimethylallyltransferase MiaA [Clostridia bacterium]|nr:tRNA (adenosine(37)-N6)-dimethylallyltransferase MiaA [Clostridia bacterium]